MRLYCLIPNYVFEEKSPIIQTELEASNVTILQGHIKMILPMICLMFCNILTKKIGLKIQFVRFQLQQFAKSF